MKYLLIVLIPAFLFSCTAFTESPWTIEPQPEDGVELKEVPGKIEGIYRSLLDSLDSALLIVTDKKIIMKIVRHPNVSIAELDLTARVNLKDTVYRDGNDSLIVRVTTDSIFQRKVHFDTLYFSSRNYVLKRDKGYYFCNQRSRDKWIVRTLRMAGHGILISRLKTKAQIDRLKEYKEPDSIAYKVPTLETLHKYLTDEKFADEWMFVRIEYGLQQ